MTDRRIRVLALALALPWFCSLADRAYGGNGDFDGNEILDLADFAAFQECFAGSTGGPVAAACTPGDHDLDNDIDLDDWTQFRPRFGFRLGPPRIDRLVPAPGTWVVNDQGLTEVRVGFDKPVTIPPDAISIRTVGGGPLAAFTHTYDEALRVLTVSFDSAVRDDRLTIVVDYSIVDVDGQELDGEIPAPANASLPSGNGFRGGQAVFRINILQGDANRDGLVDGADLAIIVASNGLCDGDPGFDSNADLNGDGCVNAIDANIFITAQGRTLPPVDGVLPSVVQITPEPSLVLPLDLTEVQVRFSEAIGNFSFNRRSLFLIDSNDSLIVPLSVTPSASGDVATFRFAGPLPQCADYTLNISNAFADTSGMLAANTDQSVLSGFRPPPPPTVGTHPSSTKDANITLSVSTFGSTTLEVTGTSGNQSVPTDPAGGAVDVNITLVPNRPNQLFFTATSACGVTSAVASTTISNDSQAPDVFIDFPQDGAQIQASTTEVAGRVGDRLSGFEGLTVLVNGQPAEVDIGIGTNGTFFLPGLVLSESLPTDIVVTATDSLGNQKVTSITVQRQEIPAGSPSMGITGGNAQTGQVEQSLVDALSVQMLRGDGTPFVGKIVTFHVTRSNGRLAAASGDAGSRTLQVRTDDQGMAQSFLTLGSDAGCGNNRVEVTSRDIAGTLMFCATATPAPADRILIGDINNQRGEAGAPLPLPLRVWVGDANNGISGVPVTYTVVDGDGVFPNGLSEITQSTDATGHVDMPFTLGMTPGNNVVEATFTSNPGLPATFIATGVARSPDQPTTLTGTVLDNANRPLGGARVVLIFDRQSAFDMLTDVDGRFSFSGIDSGAAEIVVDGSTATTLGGQSIPLFTFPFVGQEIVIVPNAANELSGPIRLPMLDPINTVVYDGTTEVILGVDGIEGLALTVRAGTRVTLPDGTVIDGTTAASVALQLNQVHFDDIPMPLPDGAFAPFAWTLQPKGATFDPPVQVALPNMAGLDPGSVAYILQWDGQMNEFIITASGQVSDDGSTINSDPGVGITVAGWGGFCPPYPPRGDLGNTCPPGIDCVGPSPSDRQAGEKAIADALGDAGDAVNNAREELDDFLDNPNENQPGVVKVALELAAIRLSCPTALTVPGAIACGIAIGLLIDDLTDLDDRLEEANRSVDDALRRLEDARAAFEALNSLEGSILPRAEVFNKFFDPIRDEIESIRDRTTLGNDGISGKLTEIQDLLDQLLDLVGTITPLKDNTAPERSLADPLSKNVFIGPDIQAEIDQLVMELELASEALIQEASDLALQATVLDTGASSQIAELFSLYRLEGWIATAFGSSAPFSPDGAFLIRNMPAGNFPVRIQVRNSRFPELVASSEFVLVVDGQRSLVVNPLEPTDTPPPTPVAVLVNVGQAVLQPNAQTQITTIGDMSDGTQQPLQTLADGTTYMSSNQAIAIVSEDGIVTGISTGAALITVSNQGVTAVKLIRVVETTVSTTVEGFVVFEDGSPATGATIETNFGGMAVTDANGFFSILLNQAPPDTSITVSASLDQEGDSFGGASSPSPVVPNGITDAGVISLTPLGRGPLFPSQRHAVGDFPRSVITVDFDGDGVVDLATANADSDDISVLLGNGDGTFAAQLRFAVGNSPQSVIAADFDGDGSIDLATANDRSDDVSVLLGNGDGTFAAQLRLAVGDSPRSVIASDFDGDGVVDLATANSRSDDVSVLLGIGDGTFAIQQRFAAGVSPESVAIGELNGDENPDLAVANFGSDDVSVLLGIGDGTFAAQQRFTVGTNPKSVAIGELNGIGEPDLVVANAGSDDVSVLLNNGDGTFAAQQRFAAGTQPVSVTIGDLNSDGNPDLAVANFSSDDVCVLLGSGDGTFPAQQRFTTGVSPESVAIGELNGDGNPDLAVANFGSIRNIGDVAILLGNGDGTFAAQQRFAAEGVPSSLAIGDLNGDGNLDLVVTSLLNGVSILLGNGDSTFAAEQRFPVGNAPRFAAIGDLNGDEIPDLSVATGSVVFNVGVGIGVWTLLGNGDGTFADQRFLATSTGIAIPYSVAIGDLNGDGNPDLAVSSGVLVLLGSGDGTFFSQLNLEVDINARSVVIADLDSDGNLDLAAANDSSASDVAVLLGNGDGSFATQVSFAVGRFPKSVIAVDLDGDEKIDLITANSSNDDISVLLGNGDGTFAAQLRFAVGDSPRSVIAADFDGDGAVDLATANAASDDVSVLLGNGDGTFAAQLRFAVGNSPQSVVAADFDGDGDVDLAAANWQSDDVSVLLNQRNP